MESGPKVRLSSVSNVRKSVTVNPIIVAPLGQGNTSDFKNH
jgi:hypothetical protein